MSVSYNTYIIITYTSPSLMATVSIEGYEIWILRRHGGPAGVNKGWKDVFVISKKKKILKFQKSCKYLKVTAFHITFCASEISVSVAAMY